MRLSLALFCAVAAVAAHAEERTVDPTWIHRNLSKVAEARVALTSSTCRYLPLFGEGDRQAATLKAITRFGRLDVSGSCTEAGFPTEEQVYVITEGSGTLLYNGRKVPVKKDDFMYLAPGAKHALSGAGLKAIWMGYRVPDAPPPLPSGAAEPVIANLSEVKKQVVGNHPPSTLYQLMIGDRASTRDRISAGLLLNSLFIMEFTPGGTNAPHHHEREEEVYLVLDGSGQMVAGGGMDGVEGRHPAAAGDAWYFRPNCTVGFYNGNTPGTSKAHILAVRSNLPQPKKRP